MAFIVFAMKPLMGASGILLRILHWTLRIGLAAVFLIAASGKFDLDGNMAGNFRAWGYPLWFMVLVGLAEGLGALLLFIDGTRRYGVGLLAAVMAGAIATHLRNPALLGVPLFPSGLVALLALLWFADSRAAARS